MATQKKTGLFHQMVKASEAALKKVEVTLAEKTLRRRGESAESDAVKLIVDAKTARLKMVEGFAKDPKATAESFDWSSAVRADMRIANLEEVRAGLRDLYFSMFGDLGNLTDENITDLDVDYTEES